MHRGEPGEQTQRRDAVFLELFPGSVCCNFIWTLGWMSCNICRLMYHPRANPNSNSDDLGDTCMCCPLNSCGWDASPRPFTESTRGSILGSICATLSNRQNQQDELSPGPRV